MSMNYNNISIVTRSELCFGCGACNVICPFKAVKMEFSSNGRILPQVNILNCTRCGLCVKVCPGIDTSSRLSEKIDSALLGDIRQTMFARSTDTDVFENAQSGGCITETISYLFDEGKIDAALLVVQDFQVAKYVVVNSKMELFRSQTSQYTPVDLVSGLLNLKEYSHVAVVGLPCHIEGIVKLKEISPQKYSNIDYLLGLICAGTQSQLIFDVVKKIAKSKIGEIDEHEEIRWRQKKFSNYQRADIAIVNPNGNIRRLDNNIRHEAKNFFTPPRCRLCFDKLNLYADIVYGDSWGISGDDTKKGGNVIICRTAKGKDLINQMLEERRIDGRFCPIEEIAKGQGMETKKKDVGRMLYIYGQKSFMTPGWAKVFNPDPIVPKKLQNVVDDFLQRSLKESCKIVNEVASMIERRLLVMRIKKIMIQIIKYK